MIKIPYLAMLILMLVSLLAPAEALEQQWGKKRTLLRGRVSTTARYSPVQLSVTRTPYVTVLTGALGEQTTMLPAHFLDYTGSLGPVRPKYTPGFVASSQARMNGKQILGPMSVILFPHAILKPSVIATQDVLVEGIPLRTSGSIIMERFGSEGSTTQVARVRTTTRVAQVRTRAASRQIAVRVARPAM